MNLVVVNKISELREKVKNFKKEGKSVGLVPTMGCLHEGHASLIRTSASKCDVTVVSVFVNPVQFGPNEDYDKYPRTLDSDRELAEKNGAAIIFAPSVAEMYPGMQKFSDITMVAPPFGMVDMMCGKSRTGHFDGVCTVVSKLFNIVQPDFAFFGMKDIQQLYIIKKMVADLNFPIEIIPCPLVREESGLALSSRNKYLSENDREIAVSISKSLFAIQNAVKNGIIDTKKLFDAAITVMDRRVEPEYIEFVDRETFEPVDTIKRPAIAAVAARVNSVRLIDNIIIGD